MKNRNIVLLFAFVLFIGSCSNNEDKSDAYGNFEATEIIVSAKSNGELLRFNIQEGDVLAKGVSIGLIDTIDLYLKKKLLGQQKKTIGSQLQSIDTKMEVQQQQLENSKLSQKRIKKCLMRVQPLKSNLTILMVLLP